MYNKKYNVIYKGMIEVNIIILPRKESFIKTFPKDSNALSILLNYKSAYPWLMNNFIQLTSYDDYYLDFCDFWYRNCPLLECQRIKIELIYKGYESIHDFIIEVIGQGYYIYLPILREYISAYQANGVHDMLIFGFDKDKRRYYISDYFQGHYGDRSCSFQELEKAIDIGQKEYWFNGFRGCIELLSYISEERAKFEEWRVKESVRDYLEGKPNSRWYESHAMWTEEETKRRRFGIMCYDTIYNHLNILKEGNIRGEADAAFLLMEEHKNVMYRRLLFMKENGYTVAPECLCFYETMSKKAREMRLMKLKYSITHDNKILGKLKSGYKGMEESERVQLRHFLDY